MPYRVKSQGASRFRRSGHTFGTDWTILSDEQMTPEILAEPHLLSEELGKDGRVIVHSGQPDPRIGELEKALARAEEQVASLQDVASGQADRIKQLEAAAKQQGRR